MSVVVNVIQPEMKCESHLTGGGITPRIFNNFFPITDGQTLSVAESVLQRRPTSYPIR